jgi:hypothetical protein
MENNTGIFIVEPKLGDFQVGAETGISKVLEPTGQYDKYLPTDETQSRNVFDCYGCVSFSAGNIFEILFEILMQRGEIPAEHIAFLKENGYFDENGKINVSDRQIAKLSGTTQNGNGLPTVADSVRHNGLVPEKKWPWPSEMKDTMTRDEKWAIYYKEVPQEVIDLGKKFAEKFDILYQWVLVGTYSTNLLRKALAYGPVQIAAAVCTPWSATENDPPIKGCGCGAQHATVVYGYTENYDWKDYDTYKSFRKLLAPNYCIPYAFQYQISAKIPPVVVPFSYVFKVNLKSGAEATAEVKALQRALQTLTRADKTPYMRPGVFGPYGPQTQTAVRKFQSDHGIMDDGSNFGPKTRTAMNAELLKIKK